MFKHQQQSFKTHEVKNYEIERQTHNLSKDKFILGYFNIPLSITDRTIRISARFEKRKQYH